MTGFHTNPVNQTLRLYLTTESETESAVFLGDLVENYALTIIKKSLERKFRSVAVKGFHLSAQGFEDLCNESCLRLVEKLADLRDTDGKEPIRNFENYTAVIAYNTWNEFFNKHAPNRKCLKNKIRYALGKSERFEIWQTNGEIFCGLTTHDRNNEHAADTTDTVLRMQEEFADYRNAALTELLTAILEKTDSALKINQMVSIVARLWAIEDATEVSFDDFRENTFSRKDGYEKEFEMRLDLEELWREIENLPVNQRIALLYNLRDDGGHEMLFAFFNAQIASLRNIAEAMNLTADECAKILPLLPFDDKTIAGRMNLTAKQVANLRKVARDNLRRRLDGKPKRRKNGGNEKQY